MTTVYRDYGALSPGSAPDNAFALEKLGQVYQDTHQYNNEYHQWERLPYMYRSFISFSYGGKNIEDFDLIATTSGDRLERDAYASFNDLTSTYDTIQGQFFWGTYFKNNSITFDLATDGITQDKLDEFKRWFRPGIMKELILAEHPNRAIMARVAQPPQFKLLPFEHPIQLQIDDKIYNTKTTVYRGEIVLEMVMDEPFWYAKQNVLGIPNTNNGYYDDAWKDANGRDRPVRENPDALKIIFEDRIPMGSAAQQSVFLGGDIYASVVYKYLSFIASPITAEEYTAGKADPDLINAAAYFNNGLEYGQTGVINFPQEEGMSGPAQYYYGAVIATTTTEGGEEVYVSGGRVGGASIDSPDTETGKNEFGIVLPIGQEAYLYYAGTAPAPVTLYFQLTPIMDSGSYYIISPANKFVTPELPYNTIKLVSTKEHNFSFTIPDIYSSYNQVIQILNTLIRANGAWLTIREYIRANVKHPAVRAWANRVLDKYDNFSHTGIIDGDIATIKSDIKLGMSYLFKDSSGDMLPASFSFNGKTGRSRGSFTYRQATAAVGESSWISYAAENLVTSEEDVGDMVKSNYLILDERNVLSDTYQVLGWQPSNPDYSYYVEHDVPNGLQALRFEFQNMYL